MSDKARRPLSRKEPSVGGIYTGITTHLKGANKRVGPCTLAGATIKEKMFEITKDEAIKLNQIKIAV